MVARLFLMYLLFTKTNIYMSIPVVDLAKFTKGNDSERTEFVYELGRAYEDVGFVAVKNHGIPDRKSTRLNSSHIAWEG
jgi:isopenicillin N synthase-like dioxygenase